MIIRLRQAGKADVPEESKAVVRLYSWQCIVEPYQPCHRNSVFDLLRDLPRLYPHGYKWLDRRLSDVLAKKARCTLALLGNLPVGLTIETPKGAHATKLSTIVVDPRY